MFYEAQYVAAGVDCVAHRHKLVYVWETLDILQPCKYPLHNRYSPAMQVTTLGLQQLID